jgi:hypothetical protein
MFASSAKQRDFWLGRGKASPAELLERYGGLKPCAADQDASVLIPVESIRSAGGEWLELIRGLHAYVNGALATWTRAAACNRAHSLEERIARWL